MGIDVNFDYSHFKRNINDFFEQVKSQIQPLIVRATEAFVETAVKWTPPGIGKSNIPAKYYKRSVFNLIKLLRGEIAKSKGSSEEGRLAHKKYGDYRFKVVDFNKKRAKKKSVFNIEKRKIC